MKKTITFLGAMVALFSMSTVNAQTAFESDMSNWTTGHPNGWSSTTPTNASNITEITTGVVYGTSSLQIEYTSTSSHQRYVTLPITVVDGEIYDIKVWARGDAELRTAFYNETAGTYGAYTAYQTVTGGTLTQHDYTLTAAGTTSVQLILSTRNTVAPDHLIIDSVAVVVSSVVATNESIYNIQYTSNQNGNSPLDGTIVNTGGIVTGTYSDGYWIQDNEGAWNGIYVYDLANTPAIGDSVTLTATVQEFYDLTELKNVANFNIISSGNTLPNPTVVTVVEANDEMYEGVFIRVEGVICSDDNAPNGNWEISGDGDNILIGRLIYEVPTKTLNAGYNIQGIAHYPFSERQLLPRNANDVELISGASIEENEIAFDIYPNPANNNVNINTTVAANVDIISITGALVASQKVVSGNNTINIAALPAGVYFVKITSENKITTQKLVVQ